MKEWVLQALKSVFSDIRKSVITLLVAAFVGGTAGIIALSETALTLFIELMQMEVPLWAALLIFGLSFLYAKIRTKRLSQSPSDEAHLLSYNGFKWLVSTINGKFWSISDIPYCPVHDSQLILSPAGQYMCPELINSKCDTKILNYKELEMLRNMANSHAESKVNGYETKH